MLANYENSLMRVSSYHLHPPAPLSTAPLSCSFSNFNFPILNCFQHSSFFLIFLHVLSVIYNLHAPTADDLRFFFTFSRFLGSGPEGDDVL